MKRIASAMTVGVVAALVAASPLNAQYVFLGGGLSKPVGDYGDFAKTGWMATGGVGFDIGNKGLWLEAQGYFGNNNHSDVDGDKTQLLSGMGALGYTFSPDAKVTPWVMAGVGFLSHKYKPATGTGGSSSSFAYEAGAGLSIKAGSKANVWFGGQYMGGTGDNKDTKLIMILAGITINVGGD